MGDPMADGSRDLMAGPVDLDRAIGDNRRKPGLVGDDSHVIC